ncbi:hypothetical protein DAT35_19350 [Vitiosangium sp. GDMCC 1.1324]|nr:hypothetical protein DAT35_19350 [Vitiosangium sp. GDMCC 1.1324]
MALVGAVCALGLTVLVGVCASVPGVRPIEHVDGRWVPITQEAQRKGSVSADLPGRQERLVGVHESSAQGRLELPRLTPKPIPPHKRVEPRHDLAQEPAVRLAVHARTRLSYVVTASHGRIADRPVVANCPAQGPPRTA